MTIVIKARKHQPNITVYREQFFDPRTPDVVPIQGYRLVVGNESVFIPEDEADELARYMLFAEPVVKSPLTSAYSEPAKE